MSKDIIWRIAEAKKTDAEGKTGVVMFIHWECVAQVDGVDRQVLQGTTSLIPPQEDQQFIEEHELTDEILLDWVFNKEYFDKAAVEARVSSLA